MSEQISRTRVLEFIREVRGWLRILQKYIVDDREGTYIAITSIESEIQRLRRDAYGDMMIVELDLNDYDYYEELIKHIASLMSRDGYIRIRYVPNWDVEVSAEGYSESEVRNDLRNYLAKYRTGDRIVATELAVLDMARDRELKAIKFINEALDTIDWVLVPP
jgi:hypothetical protein